MSWSLLRVWGLLLVLSPSLASAEPLRLVANHWPPFTDQGLPGNGGAVELVSQALARAGYQSRYYEVPWARAMAGLKAGDYDIVVGAWYDRERLAFGYYSQPYMVSRIRLLQRKGAGIHFSSIDDLRPYTIAWPRGYAYSEVLSQDRRVRKVEVNSFASAARMLEAGRVQLAVEDEQVARYHLAREDRHIQDRLEFLPQLLGSNDMHILIRRSLAQHREIARRFDRAIAEMKTDGSYAEILRRHDLQP